jgi:flagellar biosynthesis/type III secretory pathway M-ring protein FliF/YscJ
VEYLIVFVVLAVVVSAVSAPLRTARAQTREKNDPADQIAELEAAREAKYREIRDAELDVRTGKLSDADYEALDSSLRAEAIDILHELDRVREQLASAP